MMIKPAPPPPAPSPWEFAFGGAITTDYIFRGITQSNHRPSVGAYFEPRYNLTPNLQIYAGLAGASISFPNRAAAEIDIYGGVRPTFGPLALDLGFLYYWYPGGQCFNAALPGQCAANGNLPLNGNVIKSDLSFWEVYAKAAYTLNDQWVFGVNFNYTPNFLNTGAEGEWLSGTAKFTVPSGWMPMGIGMYVSGEFGRQWLGTSDSFYGVPAFPAGINYADYNTWNIGLGWTWKGLTLDVRYSGTDLNAGNCNAFTSDHTATAPGNVTPINPSGIGSNWCGDRFYAKLSGDSSVKP
jgi:hypothetical protein